MDTTPHRKRLLTVEIHDVTPAHHDAILHLRTALRRAGVRRPTLLVVPRYRAESGLRWDLRDAPQTLEWLHAEVSAGAEIVQHGLTHRAPRPPPRSLRAGLMHRHFSRGCAEFAFLTYAEARERLLVGRRVLAACGLESHGFIAPAWQQSPGAQRAIRDLGFRFTATFGGVRALVEPGPGLVGSLALTFDAAGRTIDYGKRLVMRGFERINRHAPIVRLALHPSDAEAPDVASCRRGR